MMRNSHWLIGLAGMLGIMLVLVGCDGENGTFGGGQDFEMAPLEFPFADLSKASGIGSFGYPDWNGPGRSHTGLDVYTYDDRDFDRVKVVSPTHGTVYKIEFQSHPPYHLVAPAIFIRINATWDVSIVIEPGTMDPEVAEQQRQAVYVQVGQIVAPGDLLGEIMLDKTSETLGGIHYMLQEGDRLRCAYDYSSDAAKAIYDALISGESSKVYDGEPCWVDEM